MTTVSTLKNPPLKRKARVLIVDDSAVIRTVISKTIKSQEDMEVVGVAFNGDMGVRNIKTLNPDIVILDIEMPIMDGITALPLILKEKPDVRVLICSTLSARGADISVKALSLGAADCILKPGGEAIISAHDFQENLIRVIRTLATSIINKESSTKKTTFSLQKPLVSILPKVVAIGSSTGGPTALMQVMPKLKDLPVPIVITQHMPKTFTAMLAQHITQNTGVPCAEGKEGEVLKPGQAYLAPGDYHMSFKKVGEGTVIQLNQNPPENFCRPSVNPMLRGLIPIYGSAILTVILTGMGNDGSQASDDLVKIGGQVVAQDEATCVVWGMPAAVVNAGLCTAVLPLNEIGEWVARIFKKESVRA
jgi:two-component system chemotaxis response regulator CheB